MGTLMRYSASPLERECLPVAAQTGNSHLGKMKESLKAVLLLRARMMTLMCMHCRLWVQMAARS